MLKVLAVAAALLPAIVTTASADGNRHTPVQYHQGYGGQPSFAPNGDYRRNRPDDDLNHWQLRRALRGQGFHLINIVERSRGSYVVLAEGPFGRPRLLVVHAGTGVITDIRPYRDRRGGDHRRDRDRDDDGDNQTGYGQGGNSGGYGNTGSGTSGYGSGYQGRSAPY